MNGIRNGKIYGPLMKDYRNTDTIHIVNSYFTIPDTIHRVNGITVSISERYLDFFYLPDELPKGETSLSQIVRNCVHYLIVCEWL